MERKETGSLLRKFGEVVMELALMLICILIGWIILDLFDSNLDSFSDLDVELVGLLGCVAISAILGIVWGLAKLIKKIIRNR